MIVSVTMRSNFKLPTCLNPVDYFEPYKSSTKCNDPTPECFYVAELSTIINSLAWNTLNGAFDSCTEQAVGFQDDTFNNGNTLEIYSFEFDDETPQFDPNKNYVGITIAAVRKDFKWYSGKETYR